MFPNSLQYGLTHSVPKLCSAHVIVIVRKLEYIETHNINQLFIILYFY